MTARRLRVLVLLIGALVAATSLTAGDDALARPGGGSSYKSGSSSSGSRSSSSSSGSRSTSSSSGSYSSSSGSYSSGSSGGGSAFGGLLFIVVIVVIILIGASLSRKRPVQTWATTPYIPPYEPPQDEESARRELLKLQASDPNFSLVLFDDFLVALYTEIKTAQGRGQLARYQPYLSPGAMASFGHPGGEITSVIVGSAGIEDVTFGQNQVSVTVAFETNYGIRSAHGESAVYANEEWVFSRRADARSRTPDKSRVIGCPNCGAPLDVIAAGVCSHCRSNVTGGMFDWVVESVTVHATEPRGPMLTSNVEEEGTNLPTVIAPGAAQRFGALQAADPGTSWQGLSARIGLVFTEFQSAWTARDLAKMRPYMSDALFATQTFWVEEYKRQGLRNVTEGARILSLELANVTQDAFYDAVTVRLYGSSLDFTVADSTNQVVSGNRTRPRQYTEYWTLIRGRGAKGPPKTEKVCPSCGAPLNVTMGGICTYCKAKVTTGQFDWVLSRIEQDESYRG